MRNMDSIKNVMLRVAPVFVLLLVVAQVATAQKSLLIKDARIITMSGVDIPKGSVLIEDGRITAVGTDVKAPFDVRVIDALGRVVMPGLVEAFTSKGLDRANESMDVGAFLQVYDAIDPSDLYFEEALRSGKASIHISQSPGCVIGGVSRVVHPAGLTVEEMTHSAERGLIVAFSPKPGYDRSVQMAVIRGTFEDLDRYLERLSETLYVADMKKKEELLTVGPAEARKLGRELVTLSKMDFKHRNLVRLRKGRLDAYAYCGGAMDVAAALKVAKKQGFADRLTVIVGSDAHQVVQQLQGLKRPVVLPEANLVHRKVNTITLKAREVFVPSAFEKAKVAFCLASTSDPWYAMARLVRNGVSREAALSSLTLNAARSIGLEDRLGSLEKGKDGTLLILTGDPLDAMTWVDGVVIDGEMVYQRSRDLRLRDLLKGAAINEEKARRAAEKKQAEEAKKAAAAKEKAEAAAKKKASEAKPEKSSKTRPAPTKGK